MFKPQPSVTYKPKSPRRKRTLVVVAFSSVAITTGAIASTQPFETANPFESNVPDIINGSSGIPDISTQIPGNSSSIDVGEPSVNDFGIDLPNFPGLPEGSFPRSPEEAIDVGLGSIFGKSGGPIPGIFKDILNGNMGGILETILGILTSQNKIFDEMSKVVLGEEWENADGDGDQSTPPNPYEVRLPDKEDPNNETGFITRSPIVVRRDKANQYDQELGRAMAAPMLAEEGSKWLESQITTSADMMQAGLTTTQSAITKSGEAAKATSTQEIVRRSAEISGIAATLQMQEMQQNALISESLWNMQRLESAQLQLAANTSEAADEQNRRDRADRAAGLNSAALQTLIIPVAPSSHSSKTNRAVASSAPEASSLFIEP